MSFTFSFSANADQIKLAVIILRSTYPNIKESGSAESGIDLGVSDDYPYREIRAYNSDEVTRNILGWACDYYPEFRLDNRFANINIDQVQDFELSASRNLAYKASLTPQQALDIKKAFSQAEVKWKSNVFE